MADTSSKMDMDEKTCEKAVAEVVANTDAVVVEVRGANVITCRLITRSAPRTSLAFGLTARAQDDSKPDLYDPPLAPEHVLLRAPAVPPRTKA